MGGLSDRWFDLPLARRKRLVLFLGLVAFVALMFWKAQAVLLPFGFGLLLAYLLSPVVQFLDGRFHRLARRRGFGWFRHIGRTLAILIAYLLLIGIIVGFVALVVPMVADQAQKLWAAREVVSGQLGQWIDDVMEQYRLLPPRVQQQAEDMLGRLSDYAVDVVQQALSGTALVISYTLSRLLAFLIIPFWTFFVLKDSRKLKRMFMSWVPKAAHPDLRCLTSLLNRTLASYLRGQLLMGVIMGLISVVGFSILGLNYAVLLAVFAAIFELIPNIGPWLGGIPAVLVALTQNPPLALWTALFIFVLQQVESLVLTPRIIGHSVQLHPVIVMLVLIIGSELAGLLGLFLAPIVAALLRDLFRYSYYRCQDEPLSPREALEQALKPEGFAVE